MPENEIERNYYQASQSFHRKDFSVAESLCTKIISSDPEYHQAYFLMALIAVEYGKINVAIKMLLNAVAIVPNEVTYHSSLCELYRRNNRIRQAVAHGDIATKLAPENDGAYYNLGIAYNDAGQSEKAINCYEKALEINPNHGLSANNMGALKERLGDEEGALNAYFKAIKINPNHAEAQNNIGAILSARGDIQEAKSRFSAAIDADPAFIHAHYNLSTLKKYQKDDLHLRHLENMLEKVDQMDRFTKTRFWFAIGKAWEDTKNYNQSFEAYKRGNSLKRHTISYDIKDTKSVVYDTIKAYTPAFAKKKIGGCLDQTPVFIVGMPRSGTTLIEQIFASHSDVYGAGELKDFGECVGEISGLKDSLYYADWMLQAKETDFEKIGHMYVERLRKINKKAYRITDKMPGNFFYVGLIHKVLPNAKIIHSIRNPIDVCISNYSRLFNETMPFAYDLSELAQYHKLCNEMMAYWKKILPEGTILDMVYENNVADLEKQARKMIEFCGLEWQSECLEFYKNKRQVKTASVAQVRQPIYKSSVARWKNFESYIQPLFDVLGKPDKI